MEYWSLDTTTSTRSDDDHYLSIINNENETIIISETSQPCQTSFSLRFLVPRARNASSTVTIREKSKTSSSGKISVSSFTSLTLMSARSKSQHNLHRQQPEQTPSRWSYLTHLPRLTDAASQSDFVFFENCKVNDDSKEENNNQNNKISIKENKNEENEENKSNKKENNKASSKENSKSNNSRWSSIKRSEKSVSSNNANESEQRIRVRSVSPVFTKAYDNRVHKHRLGDIDKDLKPKIVVNKALSDRHATRCRLFQRFCKASQKLQAQTSKKQQQKCSNNADELISFVKSKEQLEELKSIIINKFLTKYKKKSLADLNGSHYIELSELRGALDAVGINIPGYKARDLEQQFKQSDTNKDGKLSLEEFETLYSKLKSEKERHGFGDVVRPSTGTKVIKKEDSNSGIIHTVRDAEEIAFSKWINQNLANDPDINLSAKPIEPEKRDLYTRLNDGLIICKLINLSAPNTIDERSMNKGKSLTIYQELENIELALRSAEAIGCHVINVRPKDIRDGKEHLILGLLWQIIQIGLFAEINLTHHPGLVLLLRDDETKEDLLKLSKEELLLRWMNYHLARSEYSGREVKNFTSDIKDSIAYVHLLKQIAPASHQPPISLTPLNESDLRRRADQMLNEADKLGVKEFISAEEVVTGNQKLNMAFVANLFNTYPALDAPVANETNEPEDVIEETREEKTYRNWMNSMGVNPHVNYLYTDLQDCLIIFQLYDMIKPGVVEWKMVTKKFMPMKIKFQKLDNCNYAVDIGRKQMNFKLVGIQGSNLLDGDKTYTLALVWQLMRAYTLAMLDKIAGQGHPIVENGIIEWTNKKLESAGKKTFIQSFQDPVISDSRVICDLVDAIKPGSIRYDVLKSENTYEAKMDNARYAVSSARKIGARVFALPEDIVEVKQKMVMTIFATLMIKDYQPAQQITE